MKESGDQVWYTVSRTINLGDFESCKFELGESRSIGDKDSEAVYKELRDEVHGRMAALVKAMKHKQEQE
jgi:hypothetical protein